MKQLQNDFTTPEQSKRLLELGLPQDSANMILDGYIDSANRWIPDVYPRYLEHLYSVEIKNESELYTSNVLPCWSVGRLNEIFKICSDIHIEIYDLDLEGTQIERAMQAFEDYAEDNWLDFSKLN